MWNVSQLTLTFNSFVDPEENKKLVTHAYHDDSDIEYDDSGDSEEDLMVIDSLKR